MTRFAAVRNRNGDARSWLQDRCRSEQKRVIVTARLVAREHDDGGTLQDRMD